jgi:hypothetical protein
MPDPNKTPNKGYGKGPILGPNNKPISQADADKFKKVDNAQTASLKKENKTRSAKAKAVKEAVALAKKPAAKKPTPAKKAAPKAAAPKKGKTGY